MFDQLVADTTDTHGAGAVQSWTRVESAACAQRLAAMVTMLDAAHAATGSTDRDLWCLDNWGAVTAHIGAIQRLTSGAASNLLLVGPPLRDRFPKGAAVFAAGLISYQLARTIVTRAALVTDPDALRALDAALAEALLTWEPMGVSTTEQTVDGFVSKFDPLAVHRTQTRARGRCLDVTVEDGSGLAAGFGALFTPGDPRTRDQRRADAMGALAHGQDRLACLCEGEDCPAADLPSSSGVIVYVVAHHDTLTRPTAPAPDGTPAPGPGDGVDPGEVEESPAAPGTVE